MGMSLESAIKHCEEVASKCETETDWGMGNHFIDRSGVADVIECGKEHRQLAEWLRALKEIWDSGDCNDCLHQRNCTIRPKLGQMVRYNCYQYERKNQNDNADN